MLTHSHPWILGAHGHKNGTRGCGLSAETGWSQPCPTRMHKHAHGRKHRRTCVCHSTLHALTQWLADLVMGPSLTVLRYNNRDRPTSLAAPPCIHAVFSSEAPALIPPPSPFFLLWMEMGVQVEKDGKGCVEGTGRRLHSLLGMVANVCCSFHLFLIIFIIPPGQYTWI